MYCIIFCLNVKILIEKKGCFYIIISYNLEIVKIRIIKINVNI